MFLMCFVPFLSRVNFDVWDKIMQVIDLQDKKYLDFSKF